MNIANRSIPAKNAKSPNTRAMIIIVRERLPRNLPLPMSPFFEAAYDCEQERKSILLNRDLHVG